jgi:hypothetical protein
MNNLGFLGIVQQGRFKPVAAERDTAEFLRLTTVGLGSTQPQTGEISLTEYEGSAVMVRGVDAGEWIYSAVITDRADAILTALVQQLFSPNEPLIPSKLKPIHR